MTSEALLYSAVTALAGVIVVMWKIVTAQNATVLKKVAKLENDVMNLKSVEGAALSCGVKPPCPVRILAEKLRSDNNHQLA